MCAKRASRLVQRRIRIAEIVIPLRVRTELRVVVRWREVQRRAALPTTEHARTEKFCTLLLREVSRTRPSYGVRPRPGVEFWHFLLEVAERHEASVESPWRTDCPVTRAPCEDCSWWHDFLAGKWFCYEAQDCWLRDAVEETKVCLLGQIIALLKQMGDGSRSCPVWFPGRTDPFSDNNRVMELLKTTEISSMHRLRCVSCLEVSLTRHTV